MRKTFAYGVQNPEKISLWNPESWALDSGTQLKDRINPETSKFNDVFL